MFMNPSLFLFLLILLPQALYIECMRMGEMFPFTCIAKFVNGTWGETYISNSLIGGIAYACNGLHIGQNTLDSLRWFRGFDGKYRIYRSDYKLDRLNFGSENMVMEKIPQKIFEECLIKFLEQAKPCNPDPHRNESIYMRVNYFTSMNSLNVRKMGDTTLSITGYLANDLYGNELKSITCRVETEKYKNFDGSMGYVKTATNYGASFLAEKISTSQGYDSTLWLYPKCCGKRKCIAEGSYGNIFMVFGSKLSARKSLVTLHAEYILFPGSYRNATIHLSKSIRNLEFREECVPIDSLETMVRSNKLLEMFTTGHFVQVTPITEVKYRDSVIKIPTLEQQYPVYQQIKYKLYSHFYGNTNRIEKQTFSWMFCTNAVGNGLQVC